MQKNTNKIIFICQAAMIAALYVVLTYAINAFNLASGAIQVRVSEALTILPFFTPAAIPGLVIGCFIANLSTGAVILDVIFGTLATLLGALGTYALRKYKWLAPLPPIISNTIIVPWVSAKSFPAAFWVCFYYLHSENSTKISLKHIDFSFFKEYNGIRMFVELREQFTAKQFVDVYSIASDVYGITIR